MRSSVTKEKEGVRPSVGCVASSTGHSIILHTSAGGGSIHSFDNCSSCTSYPNIFTFSFPYSRTSYFNISYSNILSRRCQKSDAPTYPSACNPCMRLRSPQHLLRRRQSGKEMTRSPNSTLEETRTRAPPTWRQEV